MIELHADSWYTVKGVGDVASIIERYPVTLYDPNMYKDHIVRIDDTEYRVKGVETFAISRSVDNPYRLQFSLAVEKL